MDTRFEQANAGNLASLIDDQTVSPGIPLIEGPGTRIGRYKLLQLIGEGGFGSVFMAEQESPVVRRVALKIIKLGMDTRQVIARFEAERQALAMMDHPNIAKVLDAGATESGRPYFVMELVPGVPFNQYCNRKRLTLRQRIELFVPVCHAVQHAHQKGVIHRDLKPSNILVMTCDGKPVPKVIDFGVAKALHQRLTEKTLFTQFGNTIGTPEYMSPEQADMDVLGSDTRSDIYSLGVLLYELLTGVTPLDHTRLREAGYAQMLRMIREEEKPLRPSTRLTQSGDALASISADRGTDPRELTRQTAGDLDWIVMKCLEKDRARRYDTADGLARDVQRYLKDEPVEATPPSATYKLRKLVRKHKREAIAIFAVAAALVLGIIGTSLGLAKAQRNLAATHSAENRLRLEKDLASASAARAGEAEQRESAQRRKAEAVATLLESVFRGLDPYAENQAAADLKTQLIAQLDQAAARLDQDYSGEPLVRARLLNALGLTQTHLGEASKAETLFKAALNDQRLHAPADDPETLTTLDNLAITYRIAGRYAEAITLHEQVRDQRMKVLGPEHPDTLATLHNLGRAYLGGGRTVEAIKLFEQVRDQRIRTLGFDHRDTLSTLNYLANAYHSVGRSVEAMRLWEQVRDRRSRTLGPDHPETLLTLNNVAMGYRIERRGNTEAIRLLEQVRDEQIKKLGPGHPDSYIPLSNLADAYCDAGRFTEAIQLLEQVRDERIKRLGPDHADTLETLDHLALTYGRAGRSTDEINLYKKVRDKKMTALGPDHPSTLSTIRHLATAYRSAGRIDDAITLREQVRDSYFKTLPLDHPETLDVLNELAWDYIYAGRKNEAVKLWEQVLNGEMKIGAENPTTLRMMHNLALGYQDQGRIDDAIKLFEQVRDGEIKTHTLDQPYSLGNLSSLAGAYRSAGRTADAAKIFLDMMPRLVNTKTEALMLKPSDPTLLAERGNLYARLGKFQQAATDYAKAIDLEPQDANLWHDGIPLLLAIGDVEGYRWRRSQELARFKEITNTDLAHRVAKDAFALPIEGEELHIAQALADCALANPNPGWGLQTKGMAEYRLGHYRQAINYLTESAQVREWAYSKTIADLMLAMSFKQLGDDSQARAALGRATQKMEREFPKAETDDINGANDWALCQALRREAEGLIDGKTPATAPATSTQPVPSH